MAATCSVAVVSKAVRSLPSAMRCVDTDTPKKLPQSEHLKGRALFSAIFRKAGRAEGARLKVFFCPVKSLDSGLPLRAPQVMRFTATGSNDYSVKPIA